MTGDGAEVAEYGAEVAGNRAEVAENEANQHFRSTSGTSIILPLDFCLHH